VLPTYFLRTSDVAKAAGVHPNAVRLDEQWGFLPPIPRSPAGYRLFTADHVDQMCLARTALRGPWPGRAIKRSALDLVQLAAAGDLGGALEQAYRTFRNLWLRVAKNVSQGGRPIVLCDGGIQPLVSGERAAHQAAHRAAG
jgi:hypothetical protein